MNIHINDMKKALKEREFKMNLRQKISIAAILNCMSSNLSKYKNKAPKQIFKA